MYNNFGISTVEEQRDSTLANLAAYTVLKIWHDAPASVLIDLSSQPAPKELEMNSPQSPVSLSKQPESYPTLLGFHKFKAFCNQIQEITRLREHVIVLAIYFISRFRQKLSRFKTIGNKPVPGSEKALWIISLIISNKLLDDNKYANSAWAKVSKLSITEINKAERECLSILDFNLFVSEKTYSNWLEILGAIFGEAMNCQNELGFDAAPFRIVDFEILKFGIEFCQVEKTRQRVLEEQWINGMVTGYLQQPIQPIVLNGGPYYASLSSLFETPNDQRNFNFHKRITSLSEFGNISIKSRSRSFNHSNDNIEYNTLGESRKRVAAEQDGEEWRNRSLSETRYAPLQVPKHPVSHRHSHSSGSFSFGNRRPPGIITVGSSNRDTNANDIQTSISQTLRIYDTPEKERSRTEKESEDIVIQID